MFYRKKEGFNLIVNDQEIDEIDLKNKLLRDIKSELDGFTPAMIKKIIMDFIDNDDNETLSIYLEELRRL